MEGKLTLELMAKLQPIASDGSLNIPASENPVYLDGADIKHYTKMGHKPSGSSEFSARFDGAEPTMGNKDFPVTLAISDKKIIFHSIYLPKVFGAGYAHKIGSVCYGWLTTSERNIHIGVEGLRIKRTRDGRFILDICSQSDFSDILYRVIHDHDLIPYANEIIKRCKGNEYFNPNEQERGISLRDSAAPSNQEPTPYAPPPVDNSPYAPPPASNSTAMNQSRANFCPTCGAKPEPGSLFCGICGQRLK
jgi:hypothetical protein